jgi:hypothetical protein
MGVGTSFGGDVGQRERQKYLNAVAILNGSPARAALRTPREVWDHWIDLLKGRIADHWHNVVAVTGEPGSGKSTLAFRLALALDRGFSPRQIAYSATDMLGLYEQLGAGQVAVYDEAILGLLSNDFQTPEARELVKAVNIVRVKGITVLLCIPNIHRLLAGWRDEAVRYWVHCESEPRGVGWMHARSSSARYRRSSGLGLYKDPEWNPLRWQSLEGTTFWTRYNRFKGDRTNRFMADSRARLELLDPLNRARDRAHRVRRYNELRGRSVPLRRAKELAGVGSDTAELEDRRARRPRLRPGPKKR